MGYKVIDRMTAGLENQLLIFESTITNRMSSDANEEVGDYLRPLIRISETPDGYVYDHDGTSDATLVPDRLEGRYILKQPTMADLRSKFAAFNNLIGKEMTLRALDSTTATAKLQSCRGQHINYTDTSSPHGMRITFAWRLKTDFS